VVVKGPSGVEPSGKIPLSAHRRLRNFISPPGWGQAPSNKFEVRCVGVHPDN
jgi:hypothetical protein